MSQEEDDYWAKRIEETRRGQLDTVRKAAAGWSALFTAVLGTFGAVSFATGLTGIGDLADPTKSLVRGGIAVAAVLTLAATVLAGSAANSMPKQTSDLTVDAFRSDHKQRAVTALSRLRWAVRLGTAAAFVVVAGSFLVLFSDKASPPVKPTPIIAVVDGSVYCGTPAVASDGSLSIGPVSLNGATSIEAVQACPAVR